MGDSWLRDLRDAGDILRHARGPKELAKALVPNAWLAREVLNDEPPGTDAVSDPTQGARALRELGNRLKGEAIRDDGLVDYAKLRDSATFALLQRTSRTLHLVDPVRLESDEERIAFWTNLYNVLAIHGVVALDVQASVMELPSFFGVVAYRVGDYVVTLDEIENGILRRNAPHPIRREALFEDDDPRLDLCPSHVDARIHAALVCASTSCPPVAFYDAERLDEQLDAAANNYVATDLEVDDDAKVIRVPITFRYYESDFGRRPGVHLFLENHATPAQRVALKRARAADYELTYHRYDWTLNT